MHRIGRRNAVIGTVSAAILARLGTACDPDGAAPAPAPIPTSAKVVHVDLASFARLGPDTLAKARLHVAGGVYELTPHSEESRKRFFTLDSLVRERVSHFAEQVMFSSIGVQSYRVGFHNTAGSFTKLSAGIHVPDDNPTHISDDEQKAIYAVYHNPIILTLDPEVAAKVIGHIRSTDGFSALVEAIVAAGGAATPEQSEEGYSGWIGGEFTKDKTGAKIPRTSVKDQKVIEGKYLFTWVLDPAVAKLANAVAEQAQRRIHSDAALEGMKYDTTRGVGVHEQPRGLQATEGSDAFVFADQNVFRGRRAFSADVTDGKLALTVTNPNAVGTVVGFRALDAKGNVIGAPLVTLGYVAGTFYPGIARLFGPSKASFAVPLPRGAATVDFVSAAMASNFGDLEALKADGALAGAALDMYSGDQVFSGLIDFFLPMTLLAAGAGGPLATTLSAELIKKIVQNVGIGVLIEVGKIVLVDLYDAAHGGLTVDLIVANLSKIGKAIVAAIPTVLAKLDAAVITQFLVQALGLAVAEDAVEDAIPIVGWVLKALEIGAAVAQLAVEVAFIATGQALIKSSLTAAHTVSVVLQPNTKESSIFPPSARSYRLTVTPSGRLPMEMTGTFSPTPPATTIEVPRVPLAGTLSIEVTLFDEANHVVGHGVLGVTNGTEIGIKQVVDLFVDVFAAPLSASSRLSHDQRLDISTTTRKWTKTTTRPTADDGANSCDPTAKKVCGDQGTLGISASALLGQIAYSFRTPMTCGGGALLSQVHVASVSDAAKLNATPCGAEGSSRVLLASRAGEPSLLIGVTKEGPYGIFAFDPAGPLPTALSIANTVGELRGLRLDSARRHADGYVLALTEVGVEAVHVESGRRRQPQIFARQGTRVGQISTGVAVAPLRGVRGYLLLEQGVRRIQALDFEGNPLAVFGADSVIQLPRDPGREYLDLEVDHVGHIWVMSTVGNGSAPATFTVDVFDRAGTSLVTFDGVNAKAIAVDVLGSLHTVDCENAIGPGGYPEPVVSRWTYA